MQTSRNCIWQPTHYFMRFILHPFHQNLTVLSCLNCDMQFPNMKRSSLYHFLQILNISFNKAPGQLAFIFSCAFSWCRLILFIFGENTPAFNLYISVVKIVLIIIFLVPILLPPSHVIVYVHCLHAY